MPARREPAFGAGGPARAAARRPLQPIALDEEDDEDESRHPEDERGAPSPKRTERRAPARAPAPERELALPASSRVAAAAPPP